ncbi:MAG: hypothetical protein AAGG75_05125 [Bacteroidota bacterium]
MKYFFSTLVLLLFMTPFLDAQEEAAPPPLPYHEIPEAPEAYTGGAVAARMIDGLGYRYYWGTEGLRPEDLAYKPSDDSRTSGETLEHLFNLSRTILNAAQKAPNIRPVEKEELSFAEQRKRTLENLYAASQLLRASQPEEVKDFEIIFQRGERRSSFPFWNVLNGPITDAIYHVGQIVSYRRASGNPLNPMVNVFIGKTKGQ